MLNAARILEPFGVSVRRGKMPVKVMAGRLVVDLLHPETGAQELGNDRAEAQIGFGEGELTDPVLLERRVHAGIGQLLTCYQESVRHLQAEKAVLQKRLDKRYKSEPATPAIGAASVSHTLMEQQGA